MNRGSYIKQGFRQGWNALALAGGLFLGGCNLNGCAQIRHGRVNPPPQPERLEEKIDVKPHKPRNEERPKKERAKLPEPDGKYATPYPMQLEERLSKEDGRPNGKPDKFAVIINGSDEWRFVIDIGLVYQIFLENGFKKKNIYILDQDGIEEHLYPADDIAHKGSMDLLFAYLARKVEPIDLLVVHVSDHGLRKTVESKYAPGNEQEVTTIRTPFENVSESDFGQYLSGIHPCWGLVTVDMCYSEGLLNGLDKNVYVGASQTADTAKGYSSIRDGWGGFFYQAHRKTAADLDSNGVVTLDEAFSYAKQKHPWSRKGKVHPRMVSTRDWTVLSLQGPIDASTTCPKE